MEHLVNFIAVVAENLQMMYSVKWTNKKLDFETSTTLGELPFSNGVVVLYEVLLEIMEDAKCDMETILVWAFQQNMHCRIMAGIHQTC